jgi:uncharacterized membrane protein YfcA
MAPVLGFLIAIAIGITGVGGGILTAPILILFLGVPPVEAVTVSLLFAAAVKFLIAPAYLWRSQVDFRILGKLLAGGLPGVLLGSVALHRLSGARQPGIVYAVLGLTITVVAAVNLYRGWRGSARAADVRDGARWLPFLAFPIGAEVGFSSAGAGALGTVALLSLTNLTAAQVVATDVCFGLVLSLVGGGFHWSFAHSTPAILWPLVAGGLVGGIAGVYLSGVVPARPLRAVVCVWLMAIGVQLCWKGMGL